MVFFFFSFLFFFHKGLVLLADVVTHALVFEDNQAGWSADCFRGLSHSLVDYLDRLLDRFGDVFEKVSSAPSPASLDRSGGDEKDDHNSQEH